MQHVVIVELDEGKIRRAVFKYQPPEHSVICFQHNWYWRRIAYQEVEKPHRYFQVWTPTEEWQ